MDVCIGTHSKSASRGRRDVAGGDVEGDHRHRKTEKEEDEELINQVKKSENLIR